MTQEVITQAALTLVAEQGTSEFTMARLAKTLQVAPSALYNHVSRKEDILLWVQDELNSTVTIDCFATQPLPVALCQWARSYREAYAQHPGVVPVMAWQPIADAPHTIAMYEVVTKALMEHGLSGADAVNAIVALESFLFGSALDSAAPDDIFEIGDNTPHAPSFARAVAERHAQTAPGRASADAAFELGLRAMVQGLLRPTHDDVLFG